jgi:hypothetical protein
MGSVLLGRPSLERRTRGARSHRRLTDIAAILNCEGCVHRLLLKSGMRVPKIIGGKKHSSSANSSNGRTVNGLSTLACPGQCCGCSKVDYTGAVYPAGALRWCRRSRSGPAEGDPAHRHILASPRTTTYRDLNSPGEEPARPATSPLAGCSPAGRPGEISRLSHTVEISAIYPRAHRAHRPTLGFRMIDPATPRMMLRRLPLS